MPPSHPFAKDFSYLGKFLKNVQAHAQTLPGGDVKNQLVELLDGQPERWALIDELLAQSVQASTVEANEGGTEQAAEPRPAPDGGAPTRSEDDKQPPVRWTLGALTSTGNRAARSEGGWSVGSLLNQPKL